MLACENDPKRTCQHVANCSCNVVQYSCRVVFCKRATSGLLKLVTDTRDGRLQESLNTVFK